ncbi:MAG: hypothetical protein QXL14_02115 [Candidatus Aenigmatarchaeota archaeon]
MKKAKRRDENVCPFSIEFDACIFYDMCERKDKGSYDACKKAEEIFNKKINLGVVE